MIKSWLDKSTDIQKPDFGRRGWSASNARDKDLCEQGVSPQGVSPQGVLPRGASPQDVEEEEEEDRRILLRAATQRPVLGLVP